MPNTKSLNHAPRNASSTHLGIQKRKSTNYAALQHELTRLRTVLTQETLAPQPMVTEPELFPDPIDQAVAEHEIGVALSVKILAVEQEADRNDLKPL
jgi:hypothetical protein